VIVGGLGVWARLVRWKVSGKRQQHSRQSVLFINRMPP